MSETPKLNARQMAILRQLTTECNDAQKAAEAAQGKVMAFFETIKAQFDIPPEVQDVRFEENGEISYKVQVAPPPGIVAISDGGGNSPLALVPETTEKPATTEDTELQSITG